MITDLRLIERDGEKVLQYLAADSPVGIDGDIWEDVLHSYANKPNAMPKPKFEVGKFYKNGLGHKLVHVTVLRNDPTLWPYIFYNFYEEKTLFYSDVGRVHLSPSDEYNITGEWHEPEPKKEPVRIEGYLNIDADGCTEFFDTKEEAHYHANADRRRCIKVREVEGHD